MVRPTTAPAGSAKNTGASILGSIFRLNHILTRVRYAVIPTSLSRLKRSLGRLGMRDHVVDMVDRATRYTKVLLAGEWGERSIMQRPQPEWQSLRARKGGRIEGGVTSRRRMYRTTKIISCWEVGGVWRRSRRWSIVANVDGVVVLWRSCYA